MEFIEKWDDKVAKWQSSKCANLFILSHFVNFATLPPQKQRSLGRILSNRCHSRSNIVLITG